MYVTGKKYPTNKLREMIAKERLSDVGVDLLKGLLTANPRQRMDAKKALRHEWLKCSMCPK